MSIGQIFFKKLGFLDKIFSSDLNELLCDNKTVKTHQVNRSDFKKRLGFVDKIFGKKQFFLFPTVCKDVKANKER